MSAGAGGDGYLDLGDDAAAGGFALSGSGLAGITGGGGAAAGGAGRGGNPAGNLIDAAVAQNIPLDEADVDLLRNFGDHALMERVQASLQKQLQASLDRVLVDLKDQEETRERAKQQREAVGVELYGVQQQLARLQMQLESSNTQVGLLHDMRVKTDLELQKSQDGFAKRKAAVEVEEGKLDKLRGELDGILDTLRQVERYNEEMAAEVALTARAASKAEEDLEGKEKKKADQDLYIDSLTGQIKRASEQVQLYEVQMAAQREERSTAATTIREAIAEMDVIRQEKKQLLAQWQGSLVATRKRDEALAATQKAITTQQEALESMTAEESNLKREVLQAQDIHAKLEEQHEKEEATLQHLQGSLAGMARQMAALTERQEATQKTLEATDAEVLKLKIEQGRLQKLVRDRERDRMLIDRQRYAVEGEIAEHMSAKSTSEKAAKALLKEARSLIQRLHDAELACAEMESSIASSKVDALNVEAVVRGLKETLSAAEQDLQDKEKLADRYESEIKARQDTIEKKMVIVDRLNRKYEKMVADAPEAENMGPLHAEVKNMGKAIAAKREVCEGLQKRWLADQTSLVAASNEAEVKATRLRELSSQSMLLNQKRLRLEDAMSSQGGELKRLQGSIRTMQEDLARINALIAKNSSLQSKLKAANNNVVANFQAELTELERDAAVAEAKVGSLRSEKTRLLEDLLECERQIVLWEKKIELEKETQAALDPSVGAAEVAAMEKEIHRMKSRLEAVKREQERLLTELERAIDKRENIVMKNKSAVALTLAAAASSGKGILAASGKSLAAVAAAAAGTGQPGSKNGKASAGDATTRLGLKQKAGALRDDILKRLQQVQEIEAQLGAMQMQSSELLSQMDSGSEQVTALEQQSAELQRRINGCLYERQKGVEMVAGLSRLLQRLEALETGKLPPLTGEEATRVMEKLAEAEQSRRAVRAVVQTLSGTHSDLAEVLDRVAQLVDLAPALEITA